MNDPIREAFERITAPNFRDVDGKFSCQRNSHGEYVNPGLEDHWQTFQEGWEAAIDSAILVLNALDKVNGNG
jgi:hypothetical protein